MVVRIIPALSLFVVIVGNPAARVAAKAISGLDMVVLVDHSGSMWGSPEVDYRSNDREDHRVGVAQNILIRLAEHARDVRMFHRMSVINFGTKVDVALSGLELKYDPASPESVVRLARENAAKSIIEREMSNTNTSGAMEGAAKEFA